MQTAADTYVKKVQVQSPQDGDFLVMGLPKVVDSMKPCAKCGKPKGAKKPHLEVLVIQSADSKAPVDPRSKLGVEICNLINRKQCPICTACALAMAEDIAAHS